MNIFALSFLVIFHSIYNIHGNPTRDVNRDCLSCEMISKFPEGSSFVHKDVVNWCASARGICVYGERVESSICSNCLYLTHYITNKIGDNQNEEEINEFINNRVCGKLPNPVLEESCQTFILKYGHSFVHKLSTKMFDPVSTCLKDLKVCPELSTISRAVQVADSSLHIKTFMKHSCDICVNLVMEMEKILSSQAPNDNLTDTELRKRICSQFSLKQDINECETMHTTFGGHFIQMAGYNTPKKICSSVDICENANIHLIGGHKCNFGPSYWCHTTNHAIACKAMNYCKKKVWKYSDTHDTQNMPQCFLCHLLLTYIERELKKNSTEEQIEVILDTVCRKIYKDPSKLNHCQERVAKYTKSFIELTSRGVSPKVVCIIFGFCSVIKHHDTALQGELLVVRISPLIVYTSLAHRKQPKEACYTFPVTYKQFCALFIMTRQDELLQIITEAADENEVFKKIGGYSVTRSTFVCPKVFL